MKRIWLALIFIAPLAAQDAPPAPPAPKMPVPPMPMVYMPFLAQKAPRAMRSDDPQYDQGSRALDEGKWETAANIFSKVAENKGTHADGALYWKAYAQNKLGQRDAA